MLYVVPLGAAVLVAATVPAGIASAATTVSQATADSLDLGAALTGGVASTVPAPPTASTSDGAGGAVVNQSSSPFSVLSLPAFLSAPSGGSASALATYTEADPTGYSYACSGTVASGGTIQLSSSKASCTTTGGTSSGATIDLNSIPGIGSAIGNLVNVKVNIGSFNAIATEGPAGAASATGTATISNGSITVTLLSGVTSLLGTLSSSTLSQITSVTVPLNIPSGVNQQLMPAILTGVTDALNSDLSVIGAVPLVGSTLETTVSGLLDPLISGAFSQNGTGSLNNLLSLESNYQTTTSAGSFEVAALHIDALGTLGATGDLAATTVGPNAAPTTTGGTTGGGTTGGGTTGGGTTGGGTTGGGTTGGGTTGGGTTGGGPGIQPTSPSSSAGQHGTNGQSTTTTNKTGTACLQSYRIVGYRYAHPTIWTLTDKYLPVGTKVIGRVVEGNRVVLSHLMHLASGDAISIRDTRPSEGVLTGEMVYRHLVVARHAIRVLPRVICAKGASVKLRTVTFSFDLARLRTGARVGGYVFSGDQRAQSFNVEVRKGNIATFVDHTPLQGVLIGRVYVPGSRYLKVAAVAVGVEKG